MAIHGTPMEFAYDLKGILLIISTTEFSNVTDVAKAIGRQLFNFDVQNLAKESKTFQHFLTDKKLRPIAEMIALKMKQNESDPSSYPFWQFKQDMLDLQTKAANEGVGKEYASELVEWMKSGAISGTLLFHYNSSKEFILQWILINACFLLIMVMAVFIRVNDVPLIRYVLDALAVVKVEKYLLATLLLAINLWVFKLRPPHMHLGYWILPGMFCCLNIAVGVFIQKNFLK
jgi:hypothetical protein